MNDIKASSSAREQCTVSICRLTFGVNATYRFMTNWKQECLHINESEYNLKVSFKPLVLASSATTSLYNWVVEIYGIDFWVLPPCFLLTRYNGKPNSGQKQEVNWGE